MNTKTTPDLTVRGPAGMVSIIPHLCGFTLNESLVLVWMREGIITLAMRIDVDLIDEDTDAIYESIKAGVTHGPTEVAAVIWSERTDVDDAAIRVARAIERTEVYLVDVLHVRGDRWWSVLCDDPTCCGPEGHEIDHYSAEVASMTAFGAAPLPSREDALVDLAPTGEARTQAPTFDKVTELIDWRKQVTDAPEKLEPADLAGALHDIRARDTLLWDMTQEGSTQEWEDMFAAATRASHPDDAAPAATCFTITRWLAGGGPAVSRGVEVGKASDSNYALLGLVTLAVRSGMPPAEWAAMMRSLTRDDCLIGRS